MDKSPQKQMRSLADMPKPVLILEGIGIVLLVIVLLAVNGYITLPEPFSGSGVIVSMIMVGIGCLVPAMINIIWRAVHGLSFLGIDNKAASSTRREDEPAKNRAESGTVDDKKDEKHE